MPYIVLKNIIEKEKPLISQGLSFYIALHDF